MTATPDTAAEHEAPAATRRAWVGLADAYELPYDRICKHEVVFSGRVARACTVIEQAGAFSLDCGAVPSASLGQCAAGQPLAADVRLAVTDQTGNPLSTARGS